MGAEAPLPISPATAVTIGTASAAAAALVATAVEGGRRSGAGRPFDALASAARALVGRGGGGGSEPGVPSVAVVLRVAAVAGLAVLAAPALYRALQRRRQGRTFEYGPVDIQMMTNEASLELCGKDSVARKERTSLIPDSLEDLEESGAGLAADAMRPDEEVDRRAKALAAVGAPPFKRFLKEAGITTFERGTCKVLQINSGLYCNQACTHCHVESSPLRKEMASDEVIERCLFLLRNSPEVDVLDITGGAPELQSGFKRLIEGAVEIRETIRPKLRIIDRCNLTVLMEPGQENLAEFLANNRVDIIASLPSYDAAQTDKQRGRKVFERSIEGLHILNAFGYGAGGPDAKTGRRLDLVFNPPGAFLPPKQELLDTKFRQQLGEQMGVKFNKLITIANMPIKRFFDFLRKKGTLEGYMDLLVRNFNPETVSKVMCIDNVNVSWDGMIYDCDFNQQLELHVGGGAGLNVFSIESLDDARLRKAPIRTAAHCFGCTAAQGSS
mmetsp:Transcript_4626/g.17377  ORF Transcript_4626/g.17377 Transcript_4626/m.17377 type:complete len:499 (-) Transcript_4626:87-1583(-)